MFDEHLSFDDVFVPSRGASTTLSASIEESLKEFVQAAHSIGIPRTKSRLATDIQKYVTQQGMQVPFTNNRPGRLFRLLLVDDCKVPEKGYSRFRSFLKCCAV